MVNLYGSTQFKIQRSQLSDAIWRQFDPKITQQQQGKIFAANLGSKQVKQHVKRSFDQLTNGYFARVGWQKICMTCDFQTRLRINNNNTMATFCVTT